MSHFSVGRPTPRRPCGEARRGRAGMSRRGEPSHRQRKSPFCWGISAWVSGWQQQLLNKQNDAVARFAWKRSPCIVPWAAVNGTAVGAISVTSHGSIRSWIQAVAVKVRLREILVVQSVICYVSFLHAWGVGYSRELKDLEKQICWEKARLRSGHVDFSHASRGDRSCHLETRF